MCTAINVQITRVAQEHTTLGFFQNALNLKDIADVSHLEFTESRKPADQFGRKWHIANLTLIPRSTDKGRRLRRALEDPCVGHYCFHYSVQTPWFYWRMERPQKELY